MLGYILLIIGFIIGLIPVFYLGSKFNEKLNFNPSKKLLRFSTIGGIVLLSLSLLSFALVPNHNGVASSTTKQVQQQKKEEIKQRDNDPKITDSKAQIKKINVAIADSLKDDQSHSTDPKYTDPRYAFTNKVKSIQYLGHKKINVSVTKDFISLNDDQKKSVIDYAQDCAISGFMVTRAVSGEERDKGMHSTIKLDNVVIGHSKNNDNHSYNWSNTSVNAEA